MNWILVLAVILIGGGAFLGWRVGFVKTVFSVISTIIVIIITMIFSPLVTNLLKSSDVVTNTIHNSLSSIIDLTETMNMLEEEVRPELFIDDLNLPDSMKEKLIQALPGVFSRNVEFSNSNKEEKVDIIENYICMLLTETILNAIGFFITFLIASIGVAILCFTLDVISKLPILHQINILAGAGAGAIEGLVVVWIGFIIITMLGSTTFGQESLGLITENELLSFLYDNNILSKFIL